MTTMVQTKLRPLGKRVVAQRLEAEEIQGGIILPDSAQKKQETAKIIAVGDEEKAIKVGDTVLMDKYAGQEVTINDEEFIIVKSEDVIAVIEE